MDLLQASIGTRLTVTGVKTRNATLDRRLAELGLRPGASVRILRRTAGRGAIVAISDDRLALARSILGSVVVAPAGPTSSASGTTAPTTSRSAAQSPAPSPARSPELSVAGA